MVRRLLLGGLLGALLGAALGVGYAFGFRTPMTPNASMLVAIAVGVLVAPIVRKAPWRHASAVETILRALLGALLGGGIAYVALRAFDPTLPFAIPPIRDGATFTEHAWLFPTVVGFVIGALVKAFGGQDPDPKSSGGATDRTLPDRTPAPEA